MSSTITDADRAAAAGAMHRAIEAFVQFCAAADPDLDPDRFDYQIDLHRRDGSVEPLVYRAD